MKISLSGAGKRYNREWIFRNFSFEFDPARVYAITGPNGSGKSTLLQSIAGILQLNEGNIEYFFQKNIPAENAFTHLSFSGPYLEVVEEMTLVEFISFHASFKPLIPGFTIRQLAEIMQLSQAMQKQIRHYSSGMRQRVRLLQAFFSDTPAILLDEPCSNLDSSGIALYRHLVDTYCQNRLLIISSNDPAEYDFGSTIINITDYKSRRAVN